MKDHSLLVKLKTAKESKQITMTSKYQKTICAKKKLESDIADVKQAIKDKLNKDWSL